MGIHSSVYNPFQSANITANTSVAYSVTLPFTAPVTGWFFSCFTRPSNGNYSGGISLNGHPVAYYISNYDSASGSGSCQVLINKGDIVSTFGTAPHLDSCLFAPCRGN